MVKRWWSWSTQDRPVEWKIIRKRMQRERERAAALQERLSVKFKLKKQRNDKKAAKAAALAAVKAKKKEDRQKKKAAKVEALSAEKAAKEKNKKKKKAAKAVELQVIKKLKIVIKRKKKAIRALRAAVLAAAKERRREAKAAARAAAEERKNTKARKKTNTTQESSIHGPANKVGDDKATVTKDVSSAHASASKFIYRPRHESPKPSTSAAARAELIGKKANANSHNFNSDGNNPAFYAEMERLETASARSGSTSTLSDCQVQKNVARRGDLQIRLIRLTESELAKYGVVQDIGGDRLASSSDDEEDDGGSDNNF